MGTWTGVDVFQKCTFAEDRHGFEQTIVIAMGTASGRQASEITGYNITFNRQLNISCTSNFNAAIEIQ